MRLVYLDEAGVSNPAQEPFLIVAGVIIDADQDWRSLDLHLKSLARKYLPEDDRDGFVFHAYEIWHGSGYWQRDKWPRERRIAMLQDLAAIPARFHLPVVVGTVDRLATRAALLTASPFMKPTIVDQLLHAHAFMLAVQDVQTWMTGNAPREVAMLVAENTGKVQSLMKLIHNGYREQEISEVLGAVAICVELPERLNSGEASFAAFRLRVQALRPEPASRPKSASHRSCAW